MSFSRVSAPLGLFLCLSGSLAGQGSSTVTLSGSVTTDAIEDRLNLDVVDCRSPDRALCSSGDVDVDRNDSAQEVAAKLCDGLKANCPRELTITCVGSRIRIAREANFCCLANNQNDAGGLLPPDRTLLGITFSKSESPGAVSFQQSFPTAGVGAGASTEVVFVQGATTAAQTRVVAAFVSQQGEVLETRSVNLAPNSATSVDFSGGTALEVGHIVTGPGVLATEVIELSIPGVGDVPPIGVAPSPACRTPLAALRRTDELDTGVALASADAADTIACGWRLFADDGTLLGSGTTLLPPLGQTQSFPLNALDPPPDVPFVGSIQYQCERSVHAFSLFQRSRDGAIFSNAAGCRDREQVSPPEAAFAESAALPADFQTRIEESPLTAAYRATFRGLGWSLSFGEAIEAFYIGLPAAARGARFAMVPIVDQQGAGVAVYGYTYNPGTGVEGADVIQFFGENPERVRYFLDPDLESYVDVFVDEQGFASVNRFCPVPFSGAAGSRVSPAGTELCRYVECVVRIVLGTAVANPQTVNACITACSAGGVTNPACLVCLAASATVALVAWWSC